MASVTTLLNNAKKLNAWLPKKRGTNVVIATRIKNSVTSEKQAYKKRNSSYVKKSEVNIIATKKLKKYLKKMKKDKPMEQLQNFEKSSFLMMRSPERA